MSATVYAQGCTVTVINNPPPSGDPAWLAGQPVNQWIAIAGTDMNSMTAAELAPVIAAGLCDANGITTQYGRPKQGIYAYSGGTIRKTGSEMLVFGGGGAGAWAGNELRGLRLEDDAPRWRIRSAPSPASAVWLKGSAPSHDYMQDGRPNARHSYQQPQFIDSLDRFMSFGCRNVWENDSSTVNNPVDGMPWGGEWMLPTPFPHLPTQPETDATWCLKNTLTEAVYSATGSAIYQLLPPYTGTWSVLMSHATHASVPTAGVGRALMSFDSINNRMCRIGWGAQGTHQYSMINLNGAKSWTDCGLVGPQAAAIGTSGNGCGLIFDPGIGKHLYFKDDGFVYTLDWTGTAWSVDRLALTGTAPTVNASQIAGSTPAAVWTRFQYVPNLRGFCLLQAYNKPAYFVRTA